MAIKFGKVSKAIIMIVGFFIGAYLGYLIIDLIILNTGIIPKMPIRWDVISYAAGSVLFAFCLLLLSVPIVKGIFKFGRLLERILGNYTAGEITGGIIGLVLGLLSALLISFIININIALVNALAKIAVYAVLSILGLIIGKKFISQIPIFSSKTSEDSQKIILDTSAIIDGRILELIKINFLTGKYIIANFILNELRRIADSEDALKRNRGRRGLDIISGLQNEKNIEIEIVDTDFADAHDLDTKVLKLAASLNASVITTDYNLNKVATVLKVKVLNLNELSNAIKPIALPGEKMTIKIIKQGKDKEQGVGFLEDGTMVVIENGGNNVGETVDVYVTTSLQTNAGRMIFTRIEF